VQDSLKVVTYYFLEKYNVFGINDSLMMSPEFTATLGDEESKMEKVEVNPIRLSLLKAQH
jgi:hypothetical protein